MIPLSSRHTLWLSVVLLLLVPAIGYHAIDRPTREFCTNPPALMEPEFLSRVDEFESSIDAPKNYIDTSWGSLEVPGEWYLGPTWRLARTDAFESYYFGLKDHTDYLLPDDHLETRWLEIDGVRIPVRTRVDVTRQMSTLTAHLMILGGRPVENLLRAQIWSFAPQLLHGTDTLTILQVYGASSFDRAEENGELLVEWVADFWTRYREACEE